MSGEKRVFLLAALALMVLCGVAGCKEEVIDENARLAWIEKEGGNPEIQEALHYVLTVTLKRLYRSSENEGTQDPSVIDAVMAARSADLQVLKKIRKSGFTQWDDPEIMIAACKTPFPAIVRTIQRWGGDVNAKGKGGWTALMWAAGTGNNLEVVKYLVSQGADINAKDREDHTVLDWAGFRGRKDMKEYLLSIGARSGHD